MTKVKVCGITRAEDAREAAGCGADYVGFIFVPSSPRCVGPARVREIIKELPPNVTPVGVFVNAGREHMLSVIAETGIRCIQLHGSETPEETEGFPVPVWKAFRVHRTFDPSVIAAYRTAACLLDSYAPEKPGGTGSVFDWRVAVEAKRLARIILSGGITPENAAEAVRTVDPFAIDVNSGVESSPGRNDPVLLHRLFSALKTV